MPAELGFDRCRDRAGLHVHDRCFKLWHHHTLAKPSERAAARAGGACGFFLGQLGKICATFKRRDQLFGFFFGFHEDV